jgi:hypothetical protein
MARIGQVDRGSGLERALAAVVAAAFMLVHVQDWFGRYTTWFTVGFLALWSAAMALAALARPREATVRAPSAPKVLGAGAAGAAVVAALFVVHLLPAWHTPVRLAAAGAGVAVAAGAALAAGRWAARPGMCVLAAAFLLMLTTPLAYQGTPFFLPRDAWFAAAAAATFAALAAASLARIHAGWVLGIVVASGVVLRAHAIVHHEIDAVHRDMLPLVQYACEALLDGRNPYAALYWANHDLPLTYLPVMWLSYLPALAASWDVRVTSVVATAVIAALVLRWHAPPPATRTDGVLHRAAGLRGLLSGLRRRIVEGQARVTSAEVAFGTVAVTFVMVPEVFWNAVHGEPIVYWLWLVVFLDAVWAGSRPRAAVALALLVASRHFALLFIPFAALWFVLGRDGWKRGALWLLVAGALACAIVMPLFWNHPDSFLYGTFDWLTSYGPSRRTWWDVQIGLQQYFYHAGRESALVWVQLAGYGLSLCAAVLLSVRARMRGDDAGVDRGAWLPAAPAYGVFVLFNSMIWKSFLFPVLLLVVFCAALVSRPAVPRPAPPGPVTKRLLAWRTYVLVTASLALVLLVSAHRLVTSFIAHRDLRDVAAAAQYVAARDVIPGDLLVDWSVVRAGHAPGRSLFEDVYRPPDVRKVNRMRSLDLTAYERVVLFDGFSRFDPDRDFPDLTRVTSRRMGRSSVHVFRPPHVMPADAWRLAAHPEAVEAAHLLGDAPPSREGRRRGRRFVFEGRPPWNHVGPVTLRVAGTPFVAVWAHPVEDHTLLVRLRIPAPGRAVLVTALDDFAVRPLLSPVSVRVVAGSDDSRAVCVHHPNRTGRYFWDLGLLVEETVVVHVRTARQNMRHFAFDLVLDETSR